MALIGSGSKEIQNHAGDTSLSAGKLDLSLEAVGEQIGGVAWLAGSPVLYPGNLDEDNIVSGMLLPNRYKLEPRSIVTVPIASVGVAPDATKPDVPIASATCPVDGSLLAVSFSQATWGIAGTGAWTGGKVSFAVTLNGLEVGRSESIGFIDALGKHVVDASATVKAGDVIGIRLLVTGFGASPSAGSTNFVAVISVDHA